MQNYKNAVNRVQENEIYMCRCLHLAAQGIHGAPPNPMVGAVIVAQGRIIGEGYHARCGEAHAEVNAVRAVKAIDRPLLKESTIYVSLEPCAHHGKTPPCAELIVRTGFKRCVVGCVDPFAKVQGRGIAMLREASIEVEVGVLEKECRELNRRFFTFHTLHRPYVTLKWAESADGFIDRCRTGGTPAILSTPLTAMRAHRLRSLNQAILVGHATLLLDRPQLNLRHWAGNAPARFVLGNVPQGELPEGFEAFADIDTLLAELHTRGVQSLLVEGGRRTLQSFIDRGIWDEAHAEHAEKRLGAGIPSPVMPSGAPRRIEKHFGVSFSVWENNACD